MRAFAVLATTTACSFGLTGPAPTHAVDEVPACSTSGLFPSLDTLAAISDLGAGAVYGYEDGVVRALPSLLVGALYGVAAWYGTHVVTACRRQTDAAVHALVAEASSAMTAGGCSPVLDLAVRVAQEAPDAYVVLIHDPQFASCF